jgi:hypothetical protein
MKTPKMTFFPLNYVLVRVMLESLKTDQTRNLDPFGFVVFNATFNNISAISWRSVLLVEETGGL